MILFYTDLKERDENRYNYEVIKKCNKNSFSSNYCSDNFLFHNVFRQNMGKS